MKKILCDWCEDETENEKNLVIYHNQSGKFLYGDICRVCLIDVSALKIGYEILDDLGLSKAKIRYVQVYDYGNVD